MKVLSMNQLFSFSVTTIAALICFPAIALSQSIFDLPKDSQGYTSFTASPDTVKVYVDSAAGNDNNNGLSEQSPKRTLAAGYALLLDGRDDWLLLKSGSTFEQFPDWRKSGRSITKPMVIGVYGGTARAKVVPGSSEVGFLIANEGRAVGKLALTDIEFATSAAHGKAAIEMMFSPGTVLSNILIENNYIHGGFTIGVVSHGIDNNVRAQDVVLHRNIIADTISPIPGEAPHTQGVFFGTQNELKLIENSFIDNNRNRETMFAHHVYIHDENAGPALGRGNIFIDTPGGGGKGDNAVQFRPGGTYENNLHVRAAIGAVIGGGTIRNNVALHSRDINSIDERGIAFDISGGGLVEGNIAAHSLYNGAGGSGAHAFQFSSPGTLTVRNNIVYDWTTPGVGWSSGFSWNGSQPQSVTVTNNVIQQINHGRVMMHEDLPYSSAFHYSNNKYFSTNPFGGYNWFDSLDINAWRTRTGDNSVAQQVQYCDPNRDIVSYLGFLGYPSNQRTLEKFAEELRKQGKGANYRAHFFARTVNDYVRSGFVPGTTCGTGGGSSSTSSMVSSAASSSIAPSSSSSSSIRPSSSSASSSSSVAPASSSMSSMSSSVAPSSSSASSVSSGSSSSSSAGNLPLVSATVVRAIAVEGSSIRTARIKISRTGSRTRSLRVYYAMTGTATNVVDYYGLIGGVTIPRGAASVTVTVRAKRDLLIEGDETAILTVLPYTTYRASGDPALTVIRDVLPRTLRLK